MIVERLTRPIRQLEKDKEPRYADYVAGEYIGIFADSLLGKVVERLAAYEDAEEQGRLVAMPCPIGTEVWRVNFDKRRRPIERLRFDVNLYFAFGKTVFLTREEAEAVLAKLR